MKLRVLRVLVGMFAAGALALAGSGRAQSLSVNASVSGSTLSVSATGSTTGLANGTYNATVNVTNSSGSLVSTGSQSFVVGGGSGTMTLTSVDGSTYFSGMTVTNTAPQVCGTYSNPSDVVIGYIAVMTGSTPSRYQIIQPGSGSSWCANIVLDTGSNVVWAAYVSAAGSLIYATNQMNITNGSTSVNSGSARIQMTWNTANDMDLYLYSPLTSGGTATTSSYDNYIYYGRRTVSGLGGLDVDDTNGYGPENITTTAFPRPGRYLIKTNAYGMGSAATTTVVLTAYTGSGQTLNSQTFNFTRTGQSYLMGYLNVTSSGSFTFESLGTFAGEGGGQLIEPPPGYVPPPKN